MPSAKTTKKLQFSITQVFGEAWRILKAKWSFLLGVWAVIFGVSLLGEILRMAVADQSELLMTLSSLAVQVLGLIIGWHNVISVYKKSRRKHEESQ